MTGWRHNWEVKVMAALMAVLLWLALRLTPQEPEPLPSPIKMEQRHG